MDPGLSAEVLAKVKEAVRAKLKELDKYIDDELPDYVLVLVANRKSRDQMTKDLKLFLGDKSGSFTVWLHKTLEKINKAASSTQVSGTTSVNSSGGGSSSKKPQTSAIKKKKAAGKQLSPPPTFSKRRSPSVSSPSLSPPQPSKRVKGRTKSSPSRGKRSPTSSRAKRSSVSASASVSELEIEKKRPTSKLTSVVRKPSEATSSEDDEDQREGKLASLVMVKERPKMSRKAAPSGRLLLKAVRDAQTSPEPATPEPPRKKRRGIKERLGINVKRSGSEDDSVDGSESDTRKNHRKKDGNDLPECEDSVEDGGGSVKLLLEEDEVREVEEDQDVKPSFEETKFIVTLEGVQVGRDARSGVKNRLKYPSDIHSKIVVKGTEKVFDKSESGVSSAQNRSPPYAASSLKDKMDRAIGRRTSARDGSFAEPKKKPSLAVEPVVQGISSDASATTRMHSDKKALRAERFKKMPKTPTKSGDSESKDEVKSSVIGAPAVPESPAAAVRSPSVDPTSPTITTPAPFSATRCKFWPRCKLGAMCLFYHPPVSVTPVYPPTKPFSTYSAPIVASAGGFCRNFPHCPFGDGCKFGHPPCKFGENCVNPACGYSHVRRGSGKPCYYGAGCRNPACSFSHPAY